MTDLGIVNLTATEMVSGIKSKSFSARELMESHLEMIDLVNPKVNAIVTLHATSDSAYQLINTTYVETITVTDARDDMLGINLAPRSAVRGVPELLSALGVTADGQLFGWRSMGLH